MLVDPRRGRLGKFEDLWDDANSAYVKLPTIQQRASRAAAAEAAVRASSTAGPGTFPVALQP